MTSPTQRPPARGGVFPVRVATPKSGAISGALEEKYPTLGRAVIAQIFAAGNVVDCRGRSLEPDLDASAVPEGVWVYRPIHDEPPEPIVLDVVARGQAWLVADKPHGLATMPRGRYVARSLTVALRRQEKNDQIVCAHRLDRATAGLVLAVTVPELRGTYQQLFERRQVRKTYRAVAPAALHVGGIPGATRGSALGSVAGDEHGLSRGAGDGSAHGSGQGTGRGSSRSAGHGAPHGSGAWGQFVPVGPVEVEHGRDGRGEFWRVRSRMKKHGVRMANAPGKPNAETIIRPASDPYLLADVVDAPARRALAAGRKFAPGYPDHGEVRTWTIEPVTGRTHQIRVHMAALGAPIVGDPLYGGVLAGEYGSDHLAEGTVHLQLLAERLRFRDPVDGRKVDARSRLGLECALR